MKVDQNFTKLVKGGMPTGEVVAVQENLVLTTPLNGAKVFASVLFGNGARGIIWQIDETGFGVLPLTSQPIKAGEMVVVAVESLTFGVSKKTLGRVIDPLGRPLDGKGFLTPTAEVPYFRNAPTFQERDELNEQLETGVTLVDTLIPIVKGQRIAIMGDSKSGKTTFLAQTAIHQAKLGRPVIYVLVAKRRMEMNYLIKHFTDSGVMNNITLIVTTSSDPLPLGILAPYAGCALGEYLWQDQNQDTVLIYDDFTAQAKLYREMSLLLGNNAGREAYPGDMFHVQSALLERAGKLKKTGATQTVLVTGLTPNNDLTGYQSTSLISMTDGQIVFDTEIIHQGRLPAINNGLSVSRIGGRVQSSAIRNLSRSIVKELANYRSAKEYTRFNDQSSDLAEREIILGDQIYAVLSQRSDEWFNLNEQRVLLEIILRQEIPHNFDIDKLKKIVKKEVGSHKSLDEDKVSAIAGKIIKQEKV